MVKNSSVEKKQQQKQHRACLKTTPGEELLPVSLSGSFIHLQDKNFCERVVPSDKNSLSESVQNSSEIKAGSFKAGSKKKSLADALRKNLLRRKVIEKHDNKTTN